MYNWPRILAQFNTELASNFTRTRLIFFASLVICPLLEATLYKHSLLLQNVTCLLQTFA